MTLKTKGIHSEFIELGGTAKEQIGIEIQNNLERLVSWKIIKKKNGSKNHVISQNSEI